MPGANTGLVVGRTVSCLRIGCKYHKKQSRYEIRWYESENMVVVFCLECHPPTVAAKFEGLKILSEKENHKNEYLRGKASSGIVIPEA